MTDEELRAEYARRLDLPDDVREREYLQAFGPDRWSGEFRIWTSLPLSDPDQSVPDAAIGIAAPLDVPGPPHLLGLFAARLASLWAHGVARDDWPEGGGLTFPWAHLSAVCEQARNYWPRPVINRDGVMWTIEEPDRGGEGWTAVIIGDTAIAGAAIPLIAQNLDPEAISQGWLGGVTLIDLGLFAQVASRPSTIGEA